MKPLPRESVGTWTVRPASKGDQKKGSPRWPNGVARCTTVFVVEMFTTASLVLRTTSTVTVLRGLMDSGGSAGAGRRDSRPIDMVRNTHGRLNVSISSLTSGDQFTLAVEVLRPVGEPGAGARSGRQAVGAASP